MLSLPTPEPPKTPRTWTIRVRPRTVIAVVLLTPIALLGLAYSVLDVDLRDRRGLYHRVAQAQSSLKQFFQDVRHLPTKISAHVETEPQQLVLDIKADDWQKVVDKRNAALDRGLLMTTSEDYVPAKLSDGTTNYKTEIRLKGDLMDHVRHPERWSFRVKVKGNAALHGMKRFSLQPPDTRNFLDEWVFHQIARREGLLALRFEFVELAINGNPIGVYTLEEHFGKQLVEHNARREGPILRFEEATFWGIGPFFEEADPFLNAPISAFTMKDLLDGGTLEESVHLASSSLKALRDDEVPVTEVLDIDQWATYIAICDLVGAQHALSYNQLRFYFNPISAKFEPIAYDGWSGQTLRGTTEAELLVNGIPGATVVEKLFDAPEFCGAYHRALDRIARSDYVEACLDDWHLQLRDLEKVLQRQYPQYRFDPTYLQANIEVIEKFLGVDAPVPAYRCADTTQAIEIMNAQPRMLSVVSVETKSGRYAFDTPVPVRPFVPGEPARISRIAVPESVPEDAIVTDILVEATGIDRRWSVEVRPNSIGSSLETLPRVSTLSSAGIPIRTDDGHRSAELQAGTWVFDEDLVIGKGETLVVHAGAELDFKNRAALFSHGSVQLRGTEEQPVRVHSSDGTGEGVVVLQAGERSLCRFVDFDGLGSPKRGAWSTSGAVTFFESPVTIDRCVFRNNRSEDALNVVRGEFELTRSRFQSIQSDAFDCDFGQGSVRDCSFVDIGNDGIDVSGSKIDVHRVVVRRAGDKALSAGEASTMVASVIEIDTAEIGIASKDDSQVSVEQLSMDNTRLGFAVYNKKPEYGPGTIYSAFDSAETEFTYLLEPRSTLVVGGVEQDSNHGKVRDVLYGVEYGRSSK